MKFLLIDDHVLIREALRGVLKELRRDATVLEAATCRQAEQLVEEHGDLEVILLDLNLPDGDGFRMLAQWREHHPEISIVVLSASSDRDNVTYSRISWRRRPGRSSCGTRTQATSAALPRSSAATRSTSSTGSSVDSMPSPPPRSHRSTGVAARGASRATTEANSRPHSDNAGPLSAAPSVRLFIGLNQAPSYNDVTGSHRPDFQPGTGGPPGPYLAIQQGAAAVGSQAPVVNSRVRAS